MSTTMSASLSIATTRKLLSALTESWLVTARSATVYTVPFQCWRTHKHKNSLHCLRFEAGLVSEKGTRHVAWDSRGIPGGKHLSLFNATNDVKLCCEAKAFRFFFSIHGGT